MLPYLKMTPQSQSKLWRWPPAKFTLTPILHPHRFPFEESRRKVSICPIVLSASLRTMNSRCYGPFCGWGWGRGAWLAIGDAWNPEKPIEFYWSPKKLQIKSNSNRHVHTNIPCLHIAWFIEADRGKRKVIYQEETKKRKEKKDKWHIKMEWSYYNTTLQKLQTYFTFHVILLSLC